MINQELIEPVRSWVMHIEPFITGSLINERSCAPLKALCKELQEYDISVEYITGAKIVTIAGQKITILYGDMIKSHGIDFLVPDDGEPYVAYTHVIQAIGLALGVGRKEAPFCDAMAVSKYLMDYYIKRIVEILEGDEI